MINLLSFAWKNIISRKGNALVTLLIVAIVVTTFVLGHMVLTTFEEGLDRAVARFGADLLILPDTVQADPFTAVFTGEPVNIYMDYQIVDRVRGLAGVKQATPQFFAQTYSSVCCTTGEETRIVGYDQASDFVVSPWLSEGFSLADDELIVGGAVLMAEGSSAWILGEKFTVRHRLSQSGTGMDATIFMNIDIARELAKHAEGLAAHWASAEPAELVSSALIQAEPGEDLRLLKEQIELQSDGIRAVIVEDITQSLREQMAVFSKIFLFIWFALAAISLLALTSRFSAIIKGRKKEIGMIRAMGGTKQQVFSLLIIELLLPVFIGGVLGLLLAYIGTVFSYSWLQRSLVSVDSELPLIVNVSSILWGLLIALVIAFSAAFYPAWKSANDDPHDTISQGTL